MDEVANILVDIRNLLQMIVDSHPCKRCKALVRNGAILCPNCEEHNP